MKASKAQLACVGASIALMAVSGVHAARVRAMRDVAHIELGDVVSRIRAAERDIHRMEQSAAERRGALSSLRRVTSETTRLWKHTAETARQRTFTLKPDSASPAEIARDCWARGDKRCVIDVLEGRTTTEEERTLLIDAIKDLGFVFTAVDYMKGFISLYPNSKRRHEYQRFVQKYEYEWDD